MLDTFYVFTRFRFGELYRQHIVNLHRVERIEEAVHDSYTATMTNGVEINISRRTAIVLRNDWSL